MRLADYADYCMGTDDDRPSYLNDYERGDAPGLPTRPFALLGWSPFYEHRTLAAHFQRPAFAPDATPEVASPPTQAGFAVGKPGFSVRRSNWHLCLFRAHSSPLLKQVNTAHPPS